MISLSFSKIVAIVCLLSTEQFLQQQPPSSLFQRARSSITAGSSGPGSRPSRSRYTTFVLRTAHYAVVTVQVVRRGDLTSNSLFVPDSSMAQVTTDSHLSDMLCSRQQRMDFGWRQINSQENNKSFSYCLCDASTPGAGTDA